MPQDFDSYDLNKGIITGMLEKKHPLELIDKVTGDLRTLDREKADETAYEVIKDSIGRDQKTIHETSTNMASLSELEKGNQEKLLAGLNETGHKGKTVYLAARNLSESKVNALLGGLSDLWGADRIPPEIFSFFMNATRGGSGRAGYSLMSKYFINLANKGVSDDANDILRTVFENPRYGQCAWSSVADVLGFLSLLNDEQVEKAHETLGESVYDYVRGIYRNIDWKDEELKLGSSEPLGSVMKALAPLVHRGVDNREIYDMTAGMSAGELHYEAQKLGKAMAEIWTDEKIPGEIRMNGCKLLREAKEDSRWGRSKKDLLVLSKAYNKIAETGLPDTLYSALETAVRNHGDSDYWGGENVAGVFSDNLTKIDCLLKELEFTNQNSDRVVNEIVRRIEEGCGPKYVLGGIAEDLQYFSEKSKKFWLPEGLFTYWLILRESDCWQNKYGFENRRTLTGIAEDDPTAFNTGGELVRYITNNFIAFRAEKPEGARQYYKDRRGEHSISQGTWKLPFHVFCGPEYPKENRDVDYHWGAVPAAGAD